MPRDTRSDVVSRDAEGTALHEQVYGWVDELGARLCLISAKAER